jgi:epoxyqueuosine reductase
VLDARSCISYLTIEHKGDMAPHHARAIDDWVFGCDVCQEVCPWNVKFAATVNDPALEHDPSLAQLDLVQLAHVSDEEFQSLYGKTALSRPGAAGMRRNARLALGNRRQRPVG